MFNATESFHRSVLNFIDIAIPMAPNDFKLYPNGLSKAKTVVVPLLDKIYVVKFLKVISHVFLKESMKEETHSSSSLKK